MSPRELFGDGAFYILWFIFLFNGQGVNFISSLYKVGLPFLHYTKLVYHFFTVQGGYTISSLYKGGYTISSLYKVSIPFLHNTRQVYHFPLYKVVIPLLHSLFTYHQEIYHHWLLSFLSIRSLNASKIYNLSREFCVIWLKSSVTVYQGFKDSVDCSSANICWFCVQVSPLNTWVIGGHEGRFSRDPLPVFSAGGHHAWAFLAWAGTSTLWHWRSSISFSGNAVYNKSSTSSLKDPVGLLSRPCSSTVKWPGR